MNLKLRKMPKFKKFLIGFLLLAFLFQADSVFALEIKYPPVPNALTPQEIEKKIDTGEIPEEDRLPLYFKYYFNLSLIIIILICAGVIVYGGVLYLTAAGKAAVLVSARQWITSGILGLLILFSSYLILVTINPQLAILKLPWLKEISLPPKYVVSELQKTATYTEIPLGQLIEEKIITPEAEKKFQTLLETTQKAVERSKELKQKLEELNALVKACSCGKSNCEAWARGFCPLHCYCTPNSENPCEINCDKSKIKEKMEEVRNAIAELEKADKNLGAAQGPIFKDWTDLKKAGLVIDTGLDVIDYYTFLAVRHLLERKMKIEGEEKVTGLKVEVNPYSWSWPRIEVEIKSYLGEIESQAEIAKTATTTNAQVTESILTNAQTIKNEITSLINEIEIVQGKIDEALVETENVEEKITEALIKIDNFLNEAPFFLFEIRNKNNEIATTSEELKEADFQKSNIQKNCQEIEKILQTIDLSEIETLKNEVIAESDPSLKLDKLSAIKPKLSALEEKLSSIWSREAGIAEIRDPATFYLPTSEPQFK